MLRISAEAMVFISTKNNQQAQGDWFSNVFWHKTLENQSPCVQSFASVNLIKTYAAEFAFAEILKE